MFRKKDRSTRPAAPVEPGRATVAPTRATPATSSGSKGKLAYEARRAEKAGVGLEKWMAEKDRRVQAERDAIQRASRKAEPGRAGDARKPGLLRRLLDRAHRPL